jgi:putative ATP-dependent endonuclease of the OLD family
VLRALDWFFNGDKTGGLTQGDLRWGAAPPCIEVEVEFGELTDDDLPSVRRHSRG